MNFVRKSPTWSIIGHGYATWTGFALGAAFGFGFGLVFLSENWFDFGLYLILHAFYHMWEWTYVSLFHPGELSWHSFLISHGTEFYIAFAICWTEYFFERFFFPGLKANVWLVVIGFTVAVIGQAIRTFSMITGTLFSHYYSISSGFKFPPFNSRGKGKKSQTCYSWNLFISSTSCLFWMVLVVYISPSASCKSSISCFLDLRWFQVRFKTIQSLIQILFVKDRRRGRSSYPNIWRRLQTIQRKGSCINSIH